MKRDCKKWDCRPILYCVLAGLIGCWGLLAALPANGENSVADEIISLSVNRRPLVEVLDDISEATGCQFSIDENWEDFPVTASFKNEPLHKGLKIILRNLNNAVIYGADRTIKIMIYDEQASTETPGRRSMTKSLRQEPVPQPGPYRNPSQPRPVRRVAKQPGNSQDEEQSPPEDNQSVSESDEPAADSEEQEEAEKEGEESTEGSEPEQKESSSEENDDQGEEVESTPENSRETEENQ